MENDRNGVEKINEHVKTLRNASKLSIRLGNMSSTDIQNEDKKEGFRKRG